MSPRRRLVSVVGAILVVAGCGPPGDTNSDGVDLDAESAYAAQSGTSATSLTNAKAVTELFVKEDPTIDVTKSVTANADAVAAQVKSACPGATVTHATGSLQVAVDFGAGCTAGGISASGMVAASLGDHDGAVELAFTFGPLTVNGRSLTGTASATTPDGVSFTVVEDLLESGNHITFQGTAALDGDGKGATLDGNGTWQKSGEANATPLTLRGVHHAFAGCYADAGTLTLARMASGLKGKLVSVTEVVAFDAATPSTGKAMVTGAGVSSTRTLPAYGSCPHR